MRQSRPPSPSAKSDLFDPVVVKLVTRTAARLCRQPGFTRSDRLDLEQALLVRLVARRRHFDPRRGSWRSFAATVIDRQAKSILRDRHALVRNPRRESGRRSDWGADRRRPRAVVALHDIDLELDVREVVTGLPPSLRALADRLSFEPLATAARSLGIPRRTARDRLRRIRLRFEEAGLECYC